MRACGRERQGYLLGVLTLLFSLEKKVFSYEGFYNGVFWAFMTAGWSSLHIILRKSKREYHLRLIIDMSYSS